MQLLAMPIAAALTFLALLLLVRQYFRQPTFWILVALGYIAAYIAQWTGRTVWDPLTFDLGLPQAGAGIVGNMLGGGLLAGGLQIAPGPGAWPVGPRAAAPWPPRGGWAGGARRGRLLRCRRHPAAHGPSAGGHLRRPLPGCGAGGHAAGGGRGVPARA